MKPVYLDTPAGSAIAIGPLENLLVVAGPCVLESYDLGMQVASAMLEVCDKRGVPYIFKASFDKANRTSLASFRGPGLEEGLRLLEKIRSNLGVPVLSDIHEPAQASPAAEVLDIIQIPAFLCRQTDILRAAAATGKIVNLKKGQFISPWDMQHAVAKMRQADNERIILTERGSTFGYNNLVVDMRGLSVMRELGCPVIFDATHSVQLPGGAGGSSGGQREFIAPLIRAACGTGIDGLFMEVHPEPAKAMCDGPNSLALDEVGAVLDQAVNIHRCVAQLSQLDKNQ